MSDLPKPTNSNLSFRKIAVRIISVLVLAYCIGFILNASNQYFEHTSGPAGFARGFLNGAMMPAALPNLLVGRDVTIYAVNNNGLPYKLGYTTGVNVCGAVFFGIFFLRVSRWKKGRAKTQNELAPAEK